MTSGPFSNVFITIVVMKLTLTFKKINILSEFTDFVLDDFLNFRRYLQLDKYYCYHYIFYLNFLQIQYFEFLALNGITINKSTFKI